MKTQEELNILKNEIEMMDKKLAELTDDELKVVLGGLDGAFLPERHNIRSPLTENPSADWREEDQDFQWNGPDRPENKERQFEPGSRFPVRWISKDD